MFELESSPLNTRLFEVGGQKLLSWTPRDVPKKKTQLHTLITIPHCLQELPIKNVKKINHKPQKRITILLQGLAIALLPEFLLPPSSGWGYEGTAALHDCGVGIPVSKRPGATPDGCFWREVLIWGLTKCEEGESRGIEALVGEGDSYFTI